MKRMVYGITVVGALAALAVAGRGGVPALAQSRPAALDVPKFRVDPGWPKIPNNWQFGQVSSVAVDGQDHVWVLQRPGTLAPEERLVDAELSEWLGVSRTPIREALARLDAAGLVCTRPGRYTIVSPLDARSMMMRASRSVVG